MIDHWEIVVNYWFCNQIGPGAASGEQKNAPVEQKMPPLNKINDRREIVDNYWFCKQIGPGAAPGEQKNAPVEQKMPPLNKCCSLGNR